MKPKTCVLLASGFEELEAVTVIDVFNRAGLDNTVISLFDDLIVIGGQQIPIKCDETFMNIVKKDQLFDGIVIPGGLTGVQYFI
ncbi:hypothetical protein A3Q56_08462, partial [Intoshia linei]